MGAVAAKGSAPASNSVADIVAAINNIEAAVWTIVSYVVDTSTVYSEEVRTNFTCLSPTSFTPTKEGYTFVGWRKDKTASSEVLSECVMENEAITLYAVFKKTVTLTTYNGSTSATTRTGTLYYNNGNTAKPSFTLTQNALSGWTAAGWATSKTSASIAVNNGSSVSLDSDKTYYGVYRNTVTVSFNGNGNSGGSTTALTGYRYYNTGNHIDPEFTLPSTGFTKTNYRFTKWALSGVNGTKYAAGAKVTHSANVTYYALWEIQKQTGSVKGVRGSNASVTFPLAFSTTPTVTFTEDINYSTVSIASKSATGVTFRCSSDIGTGFAWEGTINWTAYI